MVQSVGGRDGPASAGPRERGALRCNSEGRQCTLPVSAFWPGTSLPSLNSEKCVPIGP